MEQHNSKTGFVDVVPLLVFFPVGYLLSTGPVHWAFEKGYISPAGEDVVQVIYLPVIWATWNWSWFEQGLTKYLSFWA
jgi:hypothetical protein